MAEWGWVDPIKYPEDDIPYRSAFKEFQELHTQLIFDIAASNGLLVESLMSAARRPKD